MVEDQLIGQTIAGRYKVLGKMGEGGMGTVYLAEHVAIEKKLALKVLLPEYARKPDLKERFLREARAAAAIDHENIVDITDFGDTPDSSVFFAMEYLDGKDLSHHIKQDGPFDWARTKRIISQICRALGAAHAKNIVHRDMKPENVFLINREGRPDFVKVLDFGIAKVSGAADGEHRLTRTGMIFGTPEYMSPEQAQGHSPDHRVDIYAVGVIMYEMLSGQVPFKADTFMGILTKHIFEAPVPPSQVDPSLAIPREAEEIVLKAMSKDREERFQSMTEMASAVARASGRVTRATGESTPPRVFSAAASTDGMMAMPSGAGSVGGTTVLPTDHDFAEKLPNRRGRIAALGLGLALFAGGIVALAYAVGGREKQSADAPELAAAPAKQVSIAVESDPPGARVLKGTTVVGTTPMVLELPQSKRSVMLTFVKEGYRERREPVVASSDGARLAVTLVKIGAPSRASQAVPPVASAADASGTTPRDDKPARPRRRRRDTSPAAPERSKAPRATPRKKPAAPQRVEDLMNPF